MKKIFNLVFTFIVSMLVLSACFSKMEIDENFQMTERTIETNVSAESSTSPESTESSNNDNSENVITKDMALKAVEKYCHEIVDWSMAEENPDIMYVQMGEETDDIYQVIFRSYTGSITYFDVNKKDGTAKMTDYVPALNIREESGTINILDYVD